MASFPSAALQYSEQNNPANQVGNIARLQGLMQNNKLGEQQIQENDLKLKAQQRAQQDQQVVQQALAKHGGNIDAALPELNGQISPQTLMGLQKFNQDSKEKALQLDEKTRASKMAQHQDLLGLIDQAQALPPDQYGQLYPQIAAKALEIMPELKGHIDPATAIPQAALGQFKLGIQTDTQYLAAAQAKQKLAADEATAAHMAKMAPLQEATAASEAKIKADQAANPPETEVGLAVKAAGGDAAAETALKRLDQSKREARPVNQFSSTANDVQTTVQAIHDGEASPVLTNYSFRDRTAIAAGLKRLGYNQAQAEQDFKATQKHLATLNGAQQERLRQAITFTSDSLDVIDKLYKDWQATGLTSGVKIFNRATLSTSKNLPGKAGAAATALEAQINDLTSELGTVYKGGNSSTDESLKLAASNLKADWNAETFQKAMGLIRTNLRLRKNSITSSQAAGVSADSQYNNQPEAPTGKEVHYKIVNGQLVAQ